VLDELVELAGFRSVPFREKLSCCGAGGGVWSGREATSLGVLERKVRFMAGAGAQAVVSVCPFCHLQFDQGQRRLGRAASPHPPVPTMAPLPPLPSLHLSQLLGLAFGMKDKALGLHTNLVPARDLARRARDAARVDRRSAGGG
jgi:heterodisulfide reductase subunit B